MRRLIVIAGPTAVGKTGVSLELTAALAARGAPVEVVSADSMQVYVGMDVGTDKLPLPARLDPPHHMIDVCLPDENFSAARYREEARACLGGIAARGSTAIVVGGSTLYLTALLTDIEIPPGDLGSELRRELDERAKRDPEGLVRELRRVDPASFASGLIDPANVRRVVRALEIYRATGLPYSELNRRWRERRPRYEMDAVLLVRDRTELYARVERRVDEMVARGLVEETRALLARGIGTTASQALGYREAAAYLRGELAFDAMVEEIKKRTRRYAKRQMTWFRAEPWYRPIDVTGLDAAAAAARVARAIGYNGGTDEPGEGRPWTR